MKTQGAAKETETKINPNYCEEDGVGFYSRNGVTVPIYHGVIRVKDADYRQHTLCWYEGRRRMRRRFSDLPEAIQEAEVVVTKLLSGEQEALKLTPTDRASYVQAARLVRPLDRDLNTFVAECVEAVKLLPSGFTLREAVIDFGRRQKSVRESRNVAELVAEFIAGKEKADRSERHVRDMRSRLTRFAEAFKMPVAALTASMLQGFLDSLDVAPRSKQNDWRLISSLLRYAVRRKYAPRDLLDELQGIELPEVKPGETLIFSPDELAEMLNAARPELVPWIAIAGFCGLRSAEILRLDWAQVNLKRRFVEVKAANAKTAQRRLVPLSDAAVAWLALYAKAAGAVTDFQNEHWFYTYIVTDVNAARKSAEKAAAKAAGREPKAVKAFNWKRNGLRHSFCSHRLAVTHDAAKTALEAGNSPQMIFRHYHSLVTEEEGKGWFNVQPATEANVVRMAQAKGAI